MRRARRALAAALALCLLLGPGAQAAGVPEKAPGAVRLALFNVSLSRRGAGLAWKAVAEGRDQARAVAEIVQRVRPDILVVQELDHDPEHLALHALAEQLRAPATGLEGVDYPHLFTAPVNSGRPSGLDLDGDGRPGGRGDAWGWGRFPGDNGMAVLSRLPLQPKAARTFRELRWARMPGALIPEDVWPESVVTRLRLSSKSHWDLPARLPDGRRLHLLISHPTPPVFDGPADRNGRRNHDEIRFWADYVSGRGWMRDDSGRQGALRKGAGFAVIGVLNADPQDGDARRGALAALLSHPRLQDPAQASAGGAAAARAQGGANAEHGGDPALDTADWSDSRGPGNLRVDYVLPSDDWEVTAGGVFWPAPDDPLARLTTGGRRPASSDHRLVWVDIR